MSGWSIALAAVAALTLATAVWNIRFGIAQHKLAATRPEHDEPKFLDMMAEQGVSAPVAQAVLASLRPYYAKGVTPHSDDQLGSILHIDAEEIGDIVEAAWTTLSLPMPSDRDPERVPELGTVGELAEYLDQRHASLAS